MVINTPKNELTNDNIISINGFTLIEAISVVAILSILAGVSIPAIGKWVKLNKISEANASHFITLHDNITDGELSFMYQKSSLFILAHMLLENGDTEGCPTVFAEASGQGIPIIGGTGAGASTSPVSPLNRTTSACCSRAWPGSWRSRPTILELCRRAAWVLKGAGVGVGAPVAVI